MKRSNKRRYSKKKVKKNKSRRKSRSSIKRGGMLSQTPETLEDRLELLMEQQRQITEEIRKIERERVRLANPGVDRVVSSMENAFNDPSNAISNIGRRFSDIAATGLTAVGEEYRRWQNWGMQYGLEKLTDILFKLPLPPEETLEILHRLNMAIESCEQTSQRLGDSPVYNMGASAYDMGSRGARRASRAANRSLRGAIQRTRGRVPRRQSRQPSQAMVNQAIQDAN